MRKLFLLAVLFLNVVLMNGQDSTKTITHELGFNTMTVLRQVTVFDLTNTNQLPWAVIYNGWYKNKYGVRAGAGIFNSYSESSTSTQTVPASTTQRQIDFRLGFNYNYCTTGRVTLNGYVDYTFSNFYYQTVSSLTVQSFPNPIVTRYSMNESKSLSNGLAIGMGVKVKLYKQLSLYAELPLMMTLTKSHSESLVSETGATDVKSFSDSKGWNSNILLPATVYLTFRF